MEVLAGMNDFYVREVGEAHDLHQQLESGRNHGLRSDDGCEDGNHQALRLSAS
jgi:hypothetical protein